MKKSLILLLVALSWCSVYAEDANTYYFFDAAILRGETTTISLYMKNSATDLTCLEAEIKLPEGITVVTDDAGNPDASLYRYRTSTHELLANVLDNGNLRLLVSSVNGAVFSGNDGPLLSFSIQADEDAPTGEYMIETVGESLLVNTTARAYYSVGVTCNLLITDDPTGINEELRIKSEESDAIYNLAGQRVSKAKNGIFIKGGKKELHR